MRLSIHHDTTYRYAERVRASIQYLRLTPQDSARQRVLDWRLDLPPSAHAQRDGHGEDDGDQPRHRSSDVDLSEEVRHREFRECVKR